MATICFGNTAGGADVNIAFAGNVALAGTRIVSEGAGDDSIALAYNEFTADANTTGLYHLNEAGWTGAANEIIDSSGNDRHGYRYSAGPDTAVAWLDRGGVFNANGVCRFSYGTIWPAKPCTVEWWNYSGIQSNRHIVAGSTWTNAMIVFTPDATHAKLAFYSGTQEYIYSNSAFLNNATDPEWIHSAIAFDNTETRFYRNGVAWGVGVAATIAQGTYLVLGGYALANPTMQGTVDELRFSNIARYSSAFSPHRYVQGNGIIQYDFGAQQALSNIAWNATEDGDWEGDIYQIWVYDQVGAAWTQVGGNSPTSPIDLSASPITIGGASLQDIIKVVQNPKADTLQTETPKLLDMTLTYAAMITTRPYYYREFVLRGAA